MTKINFIKKSKQTGFSITGLIIFMAIFGFVGVMASKCLPSWTEYMSVKKAIKTIESNNEITLPEARKAFDRTADVDRIETIKASDIIFTPSGKGVTAKFDYESKVSLFGNTSLVFRFKND